MIVTISHASELVTEEGLMRTRFCEWATISWGCFESHWDQAGQSDHRSHNWIGRLQKISNDCECHICHTCETRCSGGCRRRHTCELLCVWERTGNRRVSKRNPWNCRERRRRTRRRSIPQPVNVNRRCLRETWIRKRHPKNAGIPKDRNRWGNGLFRDWWQGCVSWLVARKRVESPGDRAGLTRRGQPKRRNPLFRVRNICLIWISPWVWVWLRRGAWRKAMGSDPSTR